MGLIKQKSMWLMHELCNIWFFTLPDHAWWCIDMKIEEYWITWMHGHAWLCGLFHAFFNFVQFSATYLLPPGPKGASQAQCLRWRARGLCEAWWICCRCLLIFGFPLMIGWPRCVVFHTWSRNLISKSWGSLQALWSDLECSWSTLECLKHTPGFTDAVDQGDLPAWLSSGSSTAKTHKDEQPCMGGWWVPVDDFVSWVKKHELKKQWTLLDFQIGKWKWGI